MAGTTKSPSGDLLGLALNVYRLANVVEILRGFLRHPELGLPCLGHTFHYRHPYIGIRLYALATIWKLGLLSSITPKSTISTLVVSKIAQLVQSSEMRDLYRIPE